MLIRGKYRLERRLGDGAMGVVWAATNELTSRVVAIKLLAEADEQLAARLRREAKAYGQLKHPNIVEIVDLGETEAGEPFLVMELLEGETLARRLKQAGRLPPAEAARIARDVARALAAAHAQHIIHRDLKPANIFLQKSEDAPDGVVVKVLDFGVAKNLAVSDGLHTTAGAAVGSLAYMSPEQARAENLDPRTDLWSVGVLLFEMLAGQRPIRGGAPQLVLELAKGAFRPAQERSPGLHPGLAAVIDRCMQPDRNARIGSAAELAALLDAALAPETRASAPDPQDMATLRINPQVLAAAAAAVAMPPPELGLGGTVKMPKLAAVKLPQQVVRSAEAAPPLDESTTVPRDPRPPLPSNPTPIGPQGTDLMIPMPTVRPQHALPPPPAPPPPPLPVSVPAPVSAPVSAPVPAPVSAPVPAPVSGSAPVSAPPPARAPVVLIALLAAGLSAALGILAYLLMR